MSAKIEKDKYYSVAIPKYVGELGDILPDKEDVEYLPIYGEDFLWIFESLSRRFFVEGFVNGLTSQKDVPVSQGDFKCRYVRPSMEAQHALLSLDEYKLFQYSLQGLSVFHPLEKVVILHDFNNNHEYTFDFIKNAKDVSTPYVDKYANFKDYINLSISNEKYRNLIFKVFGEYVECNDHANYDQIKKFASENANAKYWMAYRPVGRVIVWMFNTLSSYKHRLFRLYNVNVKTVRKTKRIVDGVVRVNEEKDGEGRTLFYHSIDYEHTVRSSTAEGSSESSHEYTYDVEPYDLELECRTKKKVVDKTDSGKDIEDVFTSKYINDFCDIRIVLLVRTKEIKIETDHSRDDSDSGSTSWNYSIPLSEDGGVSSDSGSRSYSWSSTGEYYNQIGDTGDDDGNVSFIEIKASLENKTIKLSKEALTEAISGICSLDNYFGVSEWNYTASENVQRTHTYTPGGTAQEAGEKGYSWSSSYSGSSSINRITRKGSVDVQLLGVFALVSFKDDICCEEVKIGKS